MMAHTEKQHILPRGRRRTNVRRATLIFCVGVLVCCGPWKVALAAILHSRTTTPLAFAGLYRTPSKRTPLDGGYGEKQFGQQHPQQRIIPTFGTTTTTTTTTSRRTPSRSHLISLRSTPGGGYIDNLDKNSRDHNNNNNNNSNNNNNNGGDHEKKEDEDSNFEQPSLSEEDVQRRQRKRDRLKDLLGRGTTSSTKSMVQPINVEDGSIMQDAVVPPQDSKRVKANFDKLFRGMPSLSEILSTDDLDAAVEDALNDNDKDKDSSSHTDTNNLNKKDDVWFEQDRKDIEARYAQLEQDSLEQLEELKQQEDPENFPDNAESIMKAVLRQEMKKEIKSKRNQKARDILQELESDKLATVEEQDLTQATESESVQKLLKETQAEADRMEATQAKMDSFYQYEADAKRKAAAQESSLSSSSSSSISQQPEQNADLDKWALDRLRDMRNSQTDDSDIAILDNLEDAIQELQARIEVEREEGLVKTDTMKEWQMYRAIATRLAEAAEDGTGSTVAEEDKEAISNQLKSWKEFQETEKKYRRQSGLAGNEIKMPFSWQEAGKDPMDALKEPEPVKKDERSPAEIRAEVNQKSLAALEELVRTQSGTIRSGNIERALEALRADIDAGVDVLQPAPEPEKPTGPVDLSDLFKAGLMEDTPKETPKPDASAGTTTTTTTTKKKQSIFDSPNPPQFPPMGSNNDNMDNDDNYEPPPPPDTPFFSNDDVETPPPPPDTPFFSDDNELEDDIDSIAPPNTPFFSEDLDEGTDSTGSTERSQLGSIEEQKLRAMYQRAGARTASEQEDIRIQWEEYQKFEKEQRELSGLSEERDADTESSLGDTSLGYDLSDVVKEGGDIDAEKILASIGPRPTRKKDGSASSPVLETKDIEKETPDDELTPEELFQMEEDAENSMRQSTLNPKEVSDQLYRSVSAVGGGRTRDDPEEKKKEKSAFEEFMRKEEEMRSRIEQMDKEAAEKQQAALELLSTSESFDAGDESSEPEESTDPLDDVKQAEEILQSIGPRPEKKPKRTRADYEREYSDNSGAWLNADDDDDDDDVELSEESDDESVKDFLKKQQQDQPPLRKESSGRGFLGTEFEDDEEDYEKNMRQAREFGQRREANRPQSGVDISDIFGRFASDDDLKYDASYSSAGRDRSASSSFESRKANLMEYTELDVRELNSLIDHKESAFTTGVSQYMKKINKPFREFGAIFRLEGLLVDITGFEYRAWKKVAEVYDFKMPELESVRRASVTSPDIAVRKIFFWTDDLLLCRDASNTFRNAMRDVFNEWMEEKKVAPVEEEESSTDDSFNIGSDMLGVQSSPAAPKNEQELLELQWKAWTKTAEQYHYLPPSLEEVMFSAVIGPDDAVCKAFKWTDVESEIRDVVNTYRGILGEILGIPMQDALKPQTPSPAPAGGIGDAMLASSGASVPAPSPSQALTENDLLEIQFAAWQRAALEKGFPSPTSEEAIAALTINDPAMSVRQFGWTDNPELINTIVSCFRAYVRKGVEDRSNGVLGSFGSPPPIAKAETKVEEGPRGPSDEEMLEIHIFAWTSAAESHGYETPALEEIQLAMNMDVDDCIKRLFKWTSDDELAMGIAATYKDSLKTISEKYIKKYNLKVEVTAPEAPSKETAPEQIISDKDELYQIAFDSWAEVAKSAGYESPTSDQVLYAMTVGLEDAISSGFEWTVDPLEANDLAQKYTDIVDKASASLRQTYQKDSSTESSVTPQEEKIPPYFTVVPGAAKWIKSLLDVEMPCAVISYLDREQVDVLLEQSGLSGFFARDKRVSHSSGYNRESQQMLGASLRVEKRPDHCVVFDTTPESAVAAHDVEMKCVNIIGIYPMYDLLNADSAARDFSDLTAMNLRRLFGERIYDQPMLDTQQTAPREQVRTLTKTRYWEEGDRK